MTWLVPLVVLLPLIGAASALILGRSRRLQHFTTFAVLSAVLVVSIVLLVVVDSGGPLVMEVGGW